MQHEILPLFVGCTNGQIHSILFDPQSKSLEILHSNSEVGPSPTWLSNHPTERILYACDESNRFENETGGVVALEIGRNGTLKKLVGTGSGGEGAVSLDLAKDGRSLAVANYLGSNVSTFSLLPNGLLWPPSLRTFPFSLSEPGPVKDRQSQNHPHQVKFDPTGKYLFCCDLGADVIHIFKASVDGNLEPLEDLQCKAGSGPRHLIFNPVQSTDILGQVLSYMYIVGELSNQVMVYTLRYPAPDDENRTISFESIQSISTLPSTISNSGLTHHAGEILLTPDGQSLLVTNRCPDTPSPDTIVVFRIDTSPSTSNQNSHLILARHFSSGGKEPRHFTLDPLGNYLAVTLQDSNLLIIFRWLANVPEGELEEIARVEMEKPAVTLWIRPSWMSVPNECI